MNEASYIYAELSFYNKLFDEEDWEVEVELHCYSMKKGRKELCALPFKRKVSKYDSVVYIREGWGNKKDGAFWKRGTYYWEAWIEGEKVATKYFYIESAEDALEIGEDDYLDVQSLKLYEGPYDDVNEDDRLYYTNFSGEETRYIYVERKGIKRTSRPIASSRQRGRIYSPDGWLGIQCKRVLAKRQLYGRVNFYGQITSCCAFPSQ